MRVIPGISTGRPAIAPPRARAALIGLGAVLSLLAPHTAPAQDTVALRDSRVAALALAERIAELEQRIRVLARLRELEIDSAVAAARARPNVITAGGSDGFQIRSADGNYRLRVTGYFQADGRFYLSDAADFGTDNLLVRRARPIIQGTVGKYFDFRIMPDFGQGQPTIYEAYLEARILPALAIRAGKYKPPVGLERLQSATDLRFVERGFPTNLVPNRDVGLMVSGELGRGSVQYAAAVVDGVTDLGFGDTDVNDAKEVAGRLFVVPFASRGARAPVDLGFGVSGTLGNERGTVAAPLTSSLRTPGQLTFFRYRTGTTAAAAVLEDGRRARVAPQAYLYSGTVGLLGEYTIARHNVRRDTLAREFSHRAFQIAGSIMLTGERASFGSLTPKTPFDPTKGMWGALELTARYQETWVDQTLFPIFADPAASAQKARAWTLGLNWHLARNVKVMADFERTVFAGGAANGNRPAERLFITRFQTAF